MNHRLARLLHPFAPLDHLSWSSPPGLSHRALARGVLLVTAALVVSLAIMLAVRHARAHRPIPVVPPPPDPVAAVTPRLPVVEPSPPTVLRVQAPPLVIRATIPRRTPAAR
jgi:hypothetical protein